jgi:hypothetical protein
MSRHTASAFPCKRRDIGQKFHPSLCNGLPRLSGSAKATIKQSVLNVLAYLG